jgi:hypothetical protein
MRHFREGFVALGAFVEKADVPTTSSKPRYAIAAAFARLFDPSLTGKPFETAADNWRAKSLSPGGLARVTLVRQGAGVGGSSVLITYPNGETRRMATGPSTLITKQVIEVFAPRFLRNPAVLLLSESANKLVDRDDKLARSIGLAIHVDKNLPDAILVGRIWWPNVRRL